MYSIYSLQQKVETMSVSNDEPIDDAREVEVTMQPDMTKATGDVVKDARGGLLAKLTGKQIADRPELLDVLSEGEQPVTVWVQITDKVSNQLLQEGQSLLAWVRVKGKDGKFVTKTALFSLGAVAAITITRRAIHHYKSR